MIEITFSSSGKSALCLILVHYRCILVHPILETNENDLIFDNYFCYTYSEAEVTKRILTMVMCFVPKCDIYPT